jgi:hypothetical protein
LPWPRCAYISTASIESGSRFHFHHSPFTRPGDIGAVRALEHQPLGAGEPVLQAGAAGVEGERAEVFRAVEEEVVEADGGGVVGQELGADGLAVEALLEVGEGGDGAVADDEELAVEDGFELHGGEDFGEGGGDVFGAAGVEAAAARGGDELDADAVPFPFGAQDRGVEAGEVFGFEGVGEHGGAEDGGGGGVRPFGVALEPGEEGEVGGGEAVPDLFDVVRLGAAFGKLGEGEAGEAAGGADAQAAGDELQEGEAGGGVGGVEPGGDEGGEAGFRGEVQGLDDVRQRGRGSVGAGFGPDEGDGFSEVADEVVGQGEEGGVGAGGGEFADEGGLGGGEAEFAGDGREGQAAVGVGLGLEILAQQADLVVAALGTRGGRSRRAAKAIMRLPRRSRSRRRARPRRLRFARWWMRASSLPWVIQISGAPTSSMVRLRSSQSAWSEMTSGSSTPPCFARWRTRIQPLAMQVTGSARRRAQRSAMAEGGARTMRPTRSCLAASWVAGRRSPRGMPWAS